MYIYNYIYVDVHLYTARTHVHMCVCVYIHVQETGKTLSLLRLYLGKHILRTPGRRSPALLSRHADSISIWERSSLLLWGGSAEAVKMEFGHQLRRLRAIYLNRGRQEG